jgi:hypothetical protein
MDSLIPITKIKISKDRWLNKKVKYEEKLTIKDILEDMASKSYEWILKKDDLSVNQDYISFKEEFINLMYNKYYKI